MNERPEKSRFGDLLLEMRLVEEGELASAMAERAQTGRRLEQVLADRRVIDEEHLLKAVAAQLSLETVSLRGHRTHPQVLLRVSADIARKYGVLPYAIKRTPRSETLFLVMSDPLDTTALNEVHRHCGCQVRVILAGASSLEKAINRHYGPRIPERLVDVSEDAIPLEDTDSDGPSGKNVVPNKVRVSSTNGKSSDKAAREVRLAWKSGGYHSSGEGSTQSSLPLMGSGGARRGQPDSSGSGLPPFERMTSVSSISSQPMTPSSLSVSLSESPTVDMSDARNQALATPALISKPPRRKPQAFSSRPPSAQTGEAQSLSDSSQSPSTPPNLSRNSARKRPEKSQKSMVVKAQSPSANSSSVAKPKDAWAVESRVEKMDKWAAKSSLHQVSPFAPPAVPPAIAQPPSLPERAPPQPPTERPPLKERADTTLDEDIPHAVLALEVPVDTGEDQSHPFQPLLAFDVPVGLEETGIIPEVDLPDDPFEPPPLENFPSDPQSRQALGSGDIPTNAHEVAARCSDLSDREGGEPIEAEPAELLEVEQVAESASVRIEIDEVRAALMQSGISAPSPEVTDLVNGDHVESRPEPTTFVYSLDSDQPPAMPKPPPPESKAERLVSALEKGDALDSNDREQLILALGRLMLAQGLIEREALVDELERF